MALDTTTVHLLPTYQPIEGFLQEFDVFIEVLIQEHEMLT
jgi:hypothetical protein